MYDRPIAVVRSQDVISVTTFFNRRDTKHFVQSNINVIGQLCEQIQFSRTVWCKNQLSDVEVWILADLVQQPFELLTRIHFTLFQRLHQA